MRRALVFAVLFGLGGQAGADLLTYDNLPLGELENPMILRTYMPDPGLDQAVFPNHGKGAPSPKYNVGAGKDSKGEFKPIKGIPAAIAVNHGPALSYAFDTTECRMLYAWQGGFLDMYPYWGPAKGGGRRSFDYVPRLTGTVFTLAEGGHPLTVDGAKVEKPKYVGYDLDPKGVPTFHFEAGGRKISQSVEPMTDKPLACRLVYTAGNGVKLGYRGSEGLVISETADGLAVVIEGRELSRHQGFQRNLKIKKASAAAGGDVFMNYGCIACHSTDGSLGHGPSLKNLFGRMREFEDGGEAIKADEDYIRESIMKPNAKTVKGFPPNYMPPYPLKPIELEAVLLYIKSLRDE